MHCLECLGWLVVAAALVMFVLVSVCVLASFRGPYGDGEELPWTEEEKHP